MACPNIDLLKSDAKDKPPVWYASKFGRKEALKVMLENEAVIPSIYKVNEDQQTAITSAQTEEIRTMLAKAQPTRTKPTTKEVQAVQDKYKNVDALCKAAKAGKAAYFINSK